jgi:hypothetical protein
MMVVAEKGAQDQIAQKGIREKLLCAVCDNRLGKEYEDYGARAFRKLKHRVRTDRNDITYKGLKYKELKLFQLAQLWRMAHARHMHWHRVVLPQVMLEDIRQMLLYGNPGASDCYGVMMHAVLADHETFDAFVPPTIVRIADYEFVLATFAGFSWYYCAHTTVSDERLSKFFLVTQGTIDIPVKQLRDSWHIQKLAGELEAIGKLGSNGLKPRHD